MSSSTATRGDKEDEQHSIYPKDPKEDKSRKETPVIRTSKTRGREAGMFRGLVRIQGRAWRRRKTKTIGKEVRRKGCSSREPREEATGKAPLSQEIEKPQEGPPGEQQEGSLNSLTAPMEGEEGEKPPTDSKDSIEERPSNSHYQGPKARQRRGGQFLEVEENQDPGALPGKQMKRQQRTPPWSSRKTPLTGE